MTYPRDMAQKRAQVGSVVAGVLLLVVLSACAPSRRAPDQPLVQPSAVHFIPASPEMHLRDPVWLPEGQILVTGVPLVGQQSASHLFTLSTDAPTLTRVPVPDDPECGITSQQFPRALPDGRIGYVQRCLVSNTPQRLVPQQATTLMAYDPRTGTVSRLVPYYLPFNANYFDFAPDMSLGVIDDGSGLQEHLHWLRPDALEVVPLDLAEAGRPQWAPNGGFIALEGTTDSTGLVGPARATLPKTLYLLSAHDTRLRRLVEGTADSLLLAWSPDSRWLAMVTTLHGTRGLWLVEVATGAVHLVLPGEHFGSPAFSSDGASIVVAVDETDILQQVPGGRVGLDLISLPDLALLAAH